MYSIVQEVCTQEISHVEISHPVFVFEVNLARPTMNKCPPFLCRFLSVSSIML